MSFFNKGIGSKLIWIAVLIGIPVGVIWVANLPYAVIRRPVVRNAPVLLLPSYMSVDHHYRQALVTVEQAEQLIEKATSPADLALGEQKLQDAQKHLNELPSWFVSDLSEYRYWWYDRQSSIYGFNTSRRLVGQLEAKVFQEKNAQTLLTDNMQALLSAKKTAISTGYISNRSKNSDRCLANSAKSIRTNSQSNPSRKNYTKSTRCLQP
ncbi:MAG: hypothetical protein RMX97_32710 [Nostoc sp. DedQUE11]|nr:hypothetical protein [Nostoc sp. DedQUE11]